MNISMRLKEERERLGFTQPVIAAQTDTRKGTVINWEKGASSPTAVQLASLSVIGFDIQYIVTGIRSTETLSDQELELISLYHSVPPAVKHAVMGALMAGEPIGSEADKKDHVSFSVSGRGNTVAGRNIVKK